MLSRAIDDPYTAMQPAAFENLMNNTTGVYGGIGIVVGIQEEGLTVVALLRELLVSGLGCGAAIGSSPLMARIRPT